MPPPPQPRYSRTYDPWNSVSTGHQIGDGSGPQGWRESRTLKMNSQFSAGNSGGRRIQDVVGFGSEDYGEKLGVFIPKEVRARAKNSVLDMLQKPGTMKATTTRLSSPPLAGPDPSDSRQVVHQDNGETATSKHPSPADHAPRLDAPPRKIFDGLVIYVNGSTYPLVSDHKLKHLLSENGARMALHLGRRQVTHVILGKPSGPSGGAGGGLAGGKLDREIRRVGGCGIKFVGVEW